MAQLLREVFNLPFLGSVGDLEEVLGDGRSICVVGLFGKSRSNTGSKGLILNQLISRNVFQAQQIGDYVPSGEENECYVECFYDDDNRVLYLHLVSVFDAAMFAHLCGKESYFGEMSHLFWKDQEFDHARALLFMFTVCHIVLLCHPKTAFDTTYVQLFRALETTREKQVPFIGPMLKDLGTSKEWQTSGRMCLPRLLFVCQETDIPNDYMADVPGLSPCSIRGKQKKLSVLQKMQHALEDQTYRILRKSRILTNNFNHCLFSVPANQAFVHIMAPQQDCENPMDAILGSLRTANAPTSMSIPGSGGIPINPTIPVLTDSLPTVNEENDVHSLKTFLKQHVEIILSQRGFEDNLMRGTAPPHFEFPTLKQWLEISSALFELYMYPPEDCKLYEEFENLQTSLDIDMRFSEGRCAKVLPVASRTYQENASSHYTSLVHDNKLAQAMKVYSQHARGPAYELYARKLEEECEAFWENGRQLCEIISLTGHHCIHKLHLLPDSDESEDQQPPLPRMPHTNNNRTPCACNCGKTVVQRDDPFDLRVANFEFFQQLEEKCCSKLHHHVFPVFEPRRLSTSGMNHSDQSGGEEREAKSQIEGAVQAVEKLKLGGDTQGDGPCFSLPLSLGQSALNASSQIVSHNSQAMSAVTSEMLSGGEHSMPSPKDAANYNPSSMGFLIGMTCNLSPPNLLPKFSSWTLICHGKGNLYSHSKGIDQPHFLRDSNFLLPWDIPVPKGSNIEINWPEAEKSATRRGGRNRDRKGHRDSYRAYIGLEYECPRGHRFIFTGNDKPPKVPGVSGVPKEGGSRLVASDMPLYVPCSCRNTKPPLGQLIRAFVVTPDAPFTIKLNPKVRPGAHPCPVFYPTMDDGGIPLTKNSFWVLRFPFVYVTEVEPVYPPTDNQPIPGAKLFKGLFQFSFDSAKT